MFSISLNAVHTLYSKEMIEKKPVHRNPATNKKKKNLTFCSIIAIVHQMRQPPQEKSVIFKWNEWIQYLYSIYKWMFQYLK